MDTKETLETQSDESIVDEIVEPELVEEQIIEDPVVEDSGIKQALEDAEYRYKRLQADFDNFRKRTQQEKVQLSSFVKGEVIHDLLGVLDNFDRALKVESNEETESFLEGFRMIYNNLLEMLQKNGLTEINAVGEEFDPNYHQAVMNGPCDNYEENEICEVYQKGYEVDGRVVRPSMVKVVKNI